MVCKVVDEILESITATTADEQEDDMVRRPKVRCAQCSKVGMNLKCCNRCRSVFYCNAKCQEKNWKNHQKVCTNFDA